MPVATTNITDTEHVELKSLPGGFVNLRRMAFGQIVARREMLKMSVDQQRGSKDFHGELALANAQITRFEFAHCVVDHNLEAPDGRKLNLGNPVDFDSLDPRVGQEIEAAISERNNFDDDDVQGN
jgi:hypothetical protein